MKRNETENNKMWQSERDLARMLSLKKSFNLPTQCTDALASWEKKFAHLKTKEQGT